MISQHSRLSQVSRCNCPGLSQPALIRIGRMCWTVSWVMFSQWNSMVLSGCTGMRQCQMVRPDSIQQTLPTAFLPHKRMWRCANVRVMISSKIPLQHYYLTKAPSCKVILIHPNYTFSFTEIIEFYSWKLLGTVVAL